MINDILREELSKWLAVKTWDTFHHRDVKRLHLALFRIINKIGDDVSAEGFRGVIYELVNEFHGNADKRGEQIKEAMTRIECIIPYLKDNNICQ